MAAGPRPLVEFELGYTEGEIRSWFTFEQANPNTPPPPHPHHSSKNADYTHYPYLTLYLIHDNSFTHTHMHTHIHTNTHIHIYTHHIPSESKKFVLLKSALGSELTSSCLFIKHIIHRDISQNSWNSIKYKTTVG